MLWVFYYGVMSLFEVYIKKKKEKNPPTLQVSLKVVTHLSRQLLTLSGFWFLFFVFFAQDQFARIQPTQTSGRQKLQKRSALPPAKRSTSFSSTPVRVQSCRLRAHCPSRESTTDLWIRPRVLLSLSTRN